MMEMTLMATRTDYDDVKGLLQGYDRCSSSSFLEECSGPAKHCWTRARTRYAITIWRAFDF